MTTSEPLHPSLTDDESFARTTSTSYPAKGWPPPPRVTTHILAGALAERVRRRMDVSADAEVTLTETVTYGGYSEWTQDNETEFDVTCNGRTVTFHPDASEADFRSDAPHGYDSVFARFDAWLSVAERPNEVFDSWFTFEAEAGNIVRYVSNSDTVLMRAASRQQHGTSHVSLTGVGDGYGRTWEACVIAAPDDDGFARVLSRMPLCYVEGLVLSPAVALEVLKELTDFLLLGESW